MKLKIFICDDELEQTEYLKKSIMEWAQTNHHLCEIKCFSSAEALLFDYAEDKTVDILLLDIEMNVPGSTAPHMNGVELAKTIRRDNKTVQIVFVTGYYEYFSDGFDVSALHYLLKPATKEKLYPVLDRAVTNLLYKERSVLISIADGEVKIPLSEIIYVEADKMYVKIVTTSAQYRSRMTLAKIESMLDDTFFKVQRSYIVELRFVRKITKTNISMSDGSVIPISRGIYDDVHAALIKYL